MNPVLKPKNTIIKKKNVDECESGLYDVVKKQNIWELILKIKDDNIITSVKVRPGQQKPDDETKKALNYGREKILRCGKDIQNIERIIKQDEMIVKEPKNEILVQQGIKEYQPQLQPEKLGFFGTIKNIFRRGKGGRYKKYTRKQNIQRKRTGRKKTGKMIKNKNNSTYRR